MDIFIVVSTLVGLLLASVPVLQALGFDLQIHGRTPLPPEATALKSSPPRKAWVALGLAVLSLSLSSFAVYHFFRPTIVVKTIEKPIEKIIEKPIPQDCPKVESPRPKPQPRKTNTQPTISITPHGPMETSTTGAGSAAVGVNTGTVNVGTPPTTPTDPAVVLEFEKWLDKGADIQDEFLKTDNVEELRKQRIDWIKGSYRFLVEKAGAKYAISFKNAHGNAWMGCPTNHSVAGCGDWQDIQGKRDALTQMLSELRQR